MNAKAPARPAVATASHGDATTSTDPHSGPSASSVAAVNAPPKERNAGHTVYKPNTRGSGGAIRFELNRTKGALFLEAAAQSGERQFDWEHKVTMKCGLADLGQLIATLQGRQPLAKLFHQTEKANSACELTQRDDPERAPYLMCLSRQETSDKSLRKVAIPLTHGEAAVLECALRAATTRLLGW